MDLHLHTPASTDYQEAGVDPVAILQKAEQRGLEVIAFTDHNSVRGYADLWREIEDLEFLEQLGRMLPAEIERLSEIRRLLDAVLLLPGFEFTATFGFHILAIFPETTSIRLMEHLLMTLGVSEERFGSGEVGATTDVLRAYEILHDHGALVIGAHVNSTHGVAMQGLRFGGQTKIAYTQDQHLHALEVTDLTSTSRRSTAIFFSGIKAEYPRHMHAIQGSDAHRLDRDPNRDTNLGVGERVTEVLLTNVAFAALKELFESEQFDRTRPARAGGPAADALHEARRSGNSPDQAFHERVMAARVGTAPILRDVVAMANVDGGVIYVGVGTADRKTIPGLSSGREAIASLQADIELEIDPPLPVTFESIDYDGKPVLAIHVPAGPQTPYALSPGTILVRRGADTGPASRSEIVRLVQRSVSTTQSTGREISADPVADPASSAESKAPEPVRAIGPGEKTVTVDVASSNGSATQAGSSRRRGRPAQADIPPLEEAGTLDDVAPRSGVEIIDSRDEDGVTYYAMRDLRNGNVSRNITRDTSRRLWHYAILQQESRELDEGHVRWKGDVGFWKVYRPHRGEKRYNLAHRSTGGLRVFYGVSEEGLDDRWSSVIPQPRVTA